MIEFECPHCSHKIKAQLNAAGIRSKCPRCKANITVPMPESSEPVFEDESIIEGPKENRLETWHKVLIGVGLVLFILIAPRLVYNSSGDIKDYESAQAESEKLNEEIRDRSDREFDRKLDSIMSDSGETGDAAMGETIFSDGLQYKVHSAKYSDTAGTDIFRSSLKPNGTFLLVRLSVANDGKKAALVPSPTLKDENGNEYEMDLGTSMMLENQLALERLNPEVAKTGTIAFDVPKGKKYRIVLKGAGFFSGKHEVPLTIQP